MGGHSGAAAVEAAGGMNARHPGSGRGSLAHSNASLPRCSIGADGAFGGEAREMPTANVWRVTIARLDKSKHRYSERRGTQPRRGEIVEIVVGGRLVKGMPPRK